MLPVKQVYQTDDYSMFAKIDGNRELNKLHLKRLLQSMSEDALFSPIIVNEKKQIIDGQHRFECIKELGLPVNFIVCEGYGLAHSVPGILRWCSFKKQRSMQT